MKTHNRITRIQYTTVLCGVQHTANHKCSVYATVQPCIINLISGIGTRGHLARFKKKKERIGNIYSSSNTQFHSITFYLFDDLILRLSENEKNGWNWFSFNFLCSVVCSIEPIQMIETDDDYEKRAITAVPHNGFHATVNIA